MVRASIFLLLMCISPIGASCTVAKELISEYGISFSGFKINIPRVEIPQERGADAGDLVIIRLPNRTGDIPDGFSHAALINKNSKRVWIRRIGGFAHTNEWFGPIILTRVDLKGCIIEQFSMPAN